MNMHVNTRGIIVRKVQERHLALYRAQEAYRTWMYRAIRHDRLILSQKMDSVVQFTWADENGYVVLLNGSGKMVKIHR